MPHFGKIKNYRIASLLLLAVVLTSLSWALAGAEKNGFDLSNATIPVNQILNGGPPRDGIPALSDPVLIEATEADYLEPQDRVIGIMIEGVARAYPISILNWHEIVNDQINDQRFAITYCPLCGTGVAFDTRIDGKSSDFGVSGLLYNSDVLLYDRNSESLWSQILATAISGKQVGDKLQRLPIRHTSWKSWLETYPSTQVLSINTGYPRDYRRNPYAGYEQSRALYFSVEHRAPDTYHPKELVAGINIDGVYKAYPFVELAQRDKPRFTDRINGKTLFIDWDSANRQVTITDSSGEDLIALRGFWFAWFAFHPDTLVFHADD